MPGNPQDTLGLPPIKFYNQARSTRIEALSWLRIVHKNGSSSMMSTIPKYQHSELLDYITIDIYNISLPPSNSSICLPVPKVNSSFNSNVDRKDHTLTTTFYVSPVPPKANKSFSKHDHTDWSIFHRRLDHIHDNKLAEMCKKQLLEGLPRTYPQSAQNHRRDCWICPHSNLHNDSHDITVNTDHLKLG